ncbi:UNKNOWN [Stylonychia lemnae]|uniref:Uncharacterized protein n=1 Tax=Stylonychia lemnae TaxID=5949 RepID=A0A078ALI6_STYLE|nr:UNKNOWN [Stylonychia lemnae]|eukprot:CDW82267.1 UNKNOWN [Stylonychia lemnae]
MVTNGWPSDKSIFEHAAYEILKWASENKDSYRGLVGRSIEKRSELIFASRDNIPELGQYRQMHDIERHKMEMEKEIKDIAGVQKIQLKSKRSFALTQNKLDLSIFQFKDRPLFQKKSAIQVPNSGKVELLITKPKKVPLERVQDTSFTILQRDNIIEEQEQKQEEKSRSLLKSQQSEGQRSVNRSINIAQDERSIGNNSQLNERQQDDSFQRDDDQINRSNITNQ